MTSKLNIIPAKTRVSSCRRVVHINTQRHPCAVHEIRNKLTLIIHAPRTALSQVKAICDDISGGGRVGGRRDGRAPRVQTANFKRSVLHKDDRGGDGVILFFLEDWPSVEQSQAHLRIGRYAGLNPDHERFDLWMNIFKLKTTRFESRTCRQSRTLSPQRRQREGLELQVSRSEIKKIVREKYPYNRVAKAPILKGRQCTIDFLLASLGVAGAHGRRSSPTL
ncbi:hypothetical protein EVAR_38775_1 [Eumeta japonica]|uniref:Uncharacterized protein n=1 Tax=Eumeta variegata TaxID=151549 RepID=A0A4C1WJG7_EUMVA|nr:hypothetical protein EVAR_38775_1 [Eumeta japonica]